MFDYNRAPSTRPSIAPGRIQGGQKLQGVNYPSPFFDVAHTYLPTTIKQMFRWCRYYYLTNPLIAATVNKMAEYPITDILVDEDNKGLKDKWEDFFEDTIQLRPFLIEAGLFYMNYGNAMISISHPFVKWLTCRHCGHKVQAKKARFQFRETKFYLTCEQCGSSGDATAFDQYLRTPSRMKLILWNPEDIEVRYNELTGESTYYYTVPQKTKNEITLGKRDVVTEVPQVFIDSVKSKKAVIISHDNIFHLRRPSILTGKRDRGWGIPLILPVLKDVFYLQLMKKAQEAILLERIVPLTVLFPQPGSGTSDPFQMVNLQDWKNQVVKEIQRWRIDRNYIPVMPLPLGNQVVGGDGRALLLSQEIKIWSDHIISGMGVPNEFVFGGLQWSGSNVSLRMLENQFMRYMQDLSRFIRTFLVPKIAAYLDWPNVSVRFKPFKMADDLQRKALYMQLNQAGKLSDTTLLQDSDFNPEDEDELMASETERRLEAVKKQQLAEAEIQGEMGVINARYQAKAQQVIAEEQEQMSQGQQGTAMGEPGAEMGGGPAVPQGQQPPPMGAPPPEMMPQIIQRMRAMSPDAQAQLIRQIAARNPDMAHSIAEALQPGAEMNPGEPLPETLPPRRDASSALI